MFPRIQNVSLSAKCFLERQMFPRVQNVSLSAECFLERRMFPRAPNECFLGRQMNVS